MISKIWKYRLTTGLNEIELPYWNELVHTGMDPAGFMCAWYQVSIPEGEKTITVDINMVATGEEFEKNWKYHSTIHCGVYVFHVLVPEGYKL